MKIFFYKLNRFIEKVGHAGVAIPSLWLIFYMSDTSITRGNDLRLQKSRLKYDTRKFYSTNRVVDHWNSLPNWFVTANNTNVFKRRLDQY